MPSAVNTFLQKNYIFFKSNKTIDSLIKMDLFKKNQILVSDIRYEKYANVVFKKDIYKKIGQTLSEFALFCFKFYLLP